MNPQRAEHPFTDDWLAGVSAGHVISQRDIIEYMGKPPSFDLSRSDNYCAVRLATLNLCNDLRRRLEYMGRALVVCTKHGDIHLLGDEQGARYLVRKTRNRLGSLRRDHSLQLQMDRNQMSEGTRRMHDRSIFMNSMLMPKRRRLED